MRRELGRSSLALRGAISSTLVLQHGSTASSHPLVLLSTYEHCETPIPIVTVKIKTEFTKFLSIETIP